MGCIFSCFCPIDEDLESAAPVSSSLRNSSRRYGSHTEDGVPLLGSDHRQSISSSMHSLGASATDTQQPSRYYDANGYDHVEPYGHANSVYGVQDLQAQAEAEAALLRKVQHMTVIESLPVAYASPPKPQAQLQVGRGKKVNALGDDCSTVQGTDGGSNEVTLSGGDLVAGNEEVEECLSRECIVCMCPMLPGEEIRYLPCLHVYHRECIDTWLLKRLSCPVCGDEVMTPPSEAEIIAMLASQQSQLDA